MTGGTMTYTVNGRQFLVAVVNGTGGNGAELVALAVPLPGAGGRGGRGGRGGDAAEPAAVVEALRPPLSRTTDIG